MRLPRILLAAGVGLGLFASAATALRVADGSPCESRCGNVLDSTSSDEMTCDEASYSSGQGLVFQNCINCQKRSTYFTTSDEFTNRKESDLQWMIYNLRYATSYCLFGYPDGEVNTSPCITSTACGPFLDAVTFGELAMNVSSYDYCAAWQPSIISKCLSCLRPGGNHILNNFMTVLNAACEQQPLPGKIVGVEGDFFSKEIVNMTDASTVPTLDPSYFDEGAFGLGAKVGVALGSLAFIIAVSGICIVCIGKRRRRAYLRQMAGSNEHKGWAGQVAAGATRGAPSETPLSQRPLRGGWDDSPMSAATEKGAGAAFPPGRYFSPYSSQFSSPVSAVDGPDAKWAAELGHSARGGREIGLALGGDSPQPEPPSPTKGKARAFDEMDVYGGDDGAGPSRGEAPVLGHPGYGRSSGSLPRRYTPTEDGRSGNAI